MRWRSLGGVVAAAMVVAAVFVVGAFHPTSASAEHWKAEHLQGQVRLNGEVPLSIGHGIARLLGPHAAASRLTLNFGFPLRSKAQLDALIQREAKTHQYLTRAELYAKYSPPSAQMAATVAWLRASGFRITHLSVDRLAVAASATTATIERTLHVKFNDYVRPGLKFHGLKVKSYAFFSNTSNPLVPGRLGLGSTGR